MLNTLLIVFREVLEAALLISIMGAATRSVPGRGYWMAGGVLLGLIGAGLVAGFADTISQAAEGLGQELFNASVLGAAVLMLAWHNIWMARHGRELAQQARSVGDGIKSGQRSLSALLVVIGLAVLREGSEVVLFLYGIAAQGEANAGSMLLGGALGCVLGALTGLLMYFGLLRIPLRWFFSVTSGLILLLAAGMAARAAHFLIQADMLPDLVNPLWDTSAIVPQDSRLGVLLQALLGYEAQPTGMQIVFYVATLLVIVAGMQWVRRTMPPAAPRAA